MNALPSRETPTELVANDDGEGVRLLIFRAVRALRTAVLDSVQGCVFVWWARRSCSSQPCRRLTARF